MDISVYITTQEKICPIVISFLVLRNVNFIITSVFSRRDGILRLGDPRHTYVRKNLREASVKMRVPIHIFRSRRELRFPTLTSISPRSRYLTGH